eukprot:2322202-Pleurochrysis_carterae.AAC.1
MTCVCVRERPRPCRCGARGSRRRGHARLAHRHRPRHHRRVHRAPRRRERAPGREALPFQSQPPPSPFTPRLPSVAPARRPLCLLRWCSPNGISIGLALSHGLGALVRVPDVRASWCRLFPLYPFGFPPPPSPLKEALNYPRLSITFSQPNLSCSTSHT